MRKYFYSDGANTLGPFTINELKDKEISRETMIWFHELSEWSKAGSIGELSDLFTLMPPNIQQNNSNQKVLGHSNSNNVTDIYVFIAIAYWFITNLTYFIVENVVDQWWENDLYTYFRIGSNILYAILPTIFTLSIKNKQLKIVAIGLSIILALRILYSNFEWLINIMN